MKDLKKRLRKSWVLWLCFLLIISTLLYIFVLGRNPEKATVVLGINDEVQVGQRVTIPVIIDTINDNINAAEVYLKFDPAKLRIEQVDKTGSLFKIWVTDFPNFSNEKGEINFVGGLPNPGFTGRGQIGTVTLVLLKNEPAELTFTSKTRILKNDGQASFVPLDLPPVIIEPQ